MSINPVEAIIIGLVMVAAFAAPLLIALRTRKTTRKFLPKPEGLAEAETLLEQKNYSLAVIKAFIALEICFKYRLNQRDAKMIDLIDNAAKKKLIKAEQQDIAHKLRMTRNKVIHEGSTLSQREATDYIRKASLIINTLGFEI